MTAASRCSATVAGSTSVRTDAPAIDTAPSYAPDGAHIAVGTLLTRGADLKLAAGTTVDMVLERPLILDDTKLRARGY